MKLIWILPLAMMFNLLTCDDNNNDDDGEFVIGDVKEFECINELFIAEANFFALSSFCFDENDGDKLRFIPDEDVKWWWSSNDEIREAPDTDSLTSRVDDVEDDAAAAAARKNGCDNAAAIAAWFESTKIEYSYR